MTGRRTPNHLTLMSSFGPCDDRPIFFYLFVNVALGLLLWLNSKAPRDFFASQFDGASISMAEQEYF